MIPLYRHPYLFRGVSLREFVLIAVLVLAACLGVVLLMVVRS